MASKTATVEIREDGRVTIPIETRRALGIEGQRALAEIEVSVDE